MSSMELYPGFAWAVPRAFGAAVHACRFEQGDVLYSEASAYDESRRGKRPARYHIQVFDPPRTTRVLGRDGDGQRFFSNWESPVSFEWMDYRDGHCAEMHSSQGGLFSCLWRGDLEALRADALSELPRPLLLRDLQPRVADCVGSMIEHFAAARPVGKPKRKRPLGSWLFAIAIDQSSDASRVKGQSIVRALEVHFEVTVARFSPLDLDLAEAERFHPALELLGVVVESQHSTELEGVLREVLYAGGKVTGKPGGRFQLARHGNLVEID